MRSVTVIKVMKLTKIFFNLKGSDIKKKSGVSHLFLLHLVRGGNYKLAARAFNSNGFLYGYFSGSVLEAHIGTSFNLSTVDNVQA